MSDWEKLRLSPLIEVGSGYTVKANGEVLGPLTLALLRLWAEQGRVQAGNLVSRDGFCWTPIESIPELDICWYVRALDGHLDGPLNRSVAQRRMQRGDYGPGAELLAADHEAVSERVAGEEQQHFDFIDSSVPDIAITGDPQRFVGVEDETSSGDNAPVSLGDSPWAQSQFGIDMTTSARTVDALINHVRQTNDDILPDDEHLLHEEGPRADRARFRQQVRAHEGKLLLRLHKIRRWALLGVVTSIISLSSEKSLISSSAFKACTFGSALVNSTSISWSRPVSPQRS